MDSAKNKRFNVDIVIFFYLLIIVVSKVVIMDDNFDFVN